MNDEMEDNDVARRRHRRLLRFLLLLLRRRRRRCRRSPTSIARPPWYSRTRPPSTPERRNTAMRREACGACEPQSTLVLLSATLSRRRFRGCWVCVCVYLRYSVRFPTRTHHTRAHQQPGTARLRRASHLLTEYHRDRYIADDTHTHTHTHVHALTRIHRCERTKLSRVCLRSLFAGESRGSLFPLAVAGRSRLCLLSEEADISPVFTETFSCFFTLRFTLEDLEEMSSRRQAGLSRLCRTVLVYPGWKDFSSTSDDERSSLEVYIYRSGKYGNFPGRSLG